MTDENPEVPSAPVERKASEILLGIEKDTKEILAYLRNLDQNHKILMERMRLLESRFPAAPVISTIFSPSAAVSKSTKSNSPFETPSDLKSKIQAAMASAKAEEPGILNKVEREISEVEVEFPELQKASVLEKSPELKNLQSRVIPVQQRVTYSDGKNIYMAAVSIIDNNGKLYKETKTNQTGKWMAPLPNGEYTVQISKSGTPIKPAINVKYTITVPNQDEPLELESRKLS